MAFSSHFSFQVNNKTKQNKKLKSRWELECSKNRKFLILFPVVFLTKHFAYLMLQISCSGGLSSCCLQFCAPPAIANSCPCRAGNEEFHEEESECCCCCVLQFILCQSWIFGLPLAPLTFPLAEEPGCVQPQVQSCDLLSPTAWLGFSHVTLAGF